MSEENTPFDDLPREYQLRITEHLFRRIERQLSYMKHMEKEPSTKQAWVMHAIQRKLEKEQGTKVLSPRKKYRAIKLYIEKELSERVDSLLQSSKKILGGYSKKRWIEDAIEELLEEEAHNVEQLAHSIHGD